ncbi:NAD-dependent epimerase/dehydratase family protein [Arthrobacter castelli]|uniref:polysaccharide biosynthesis C-terminal domain-containing protein n=1 Tax=Arthrobacter castelli TaxID=271431 RepID=UPI0003FAB542|nr:NAD-dependent epimerase/dehydratase family protein [Arthrobacter castelli]
MKVAVTGGHGFLGWHTAVRLRALYDIEPVLLRREDFADPSGLSTALSQVDTVIHLAGVNRAGTDDEVESGNMQIAEVLAEALTEAGGRHHVVYGNSIQSELDNPYGRGKARAGEALKSALMTTGGSVANVLLPNLFGEHGQPYYNSFVATFCHEIAHGRKPEVTGDKEVRLLHAQRAADLLIESSLRRENHQRTPEGDSFQVSEILIRLIDFDDAYGQGQIPALTDPFTIDLFNTFRSYLFPQHFPFRPNVNADERGELFETVRMHGGTGQTFVSSTVPGAVRGEHYHLNKIERFFVLKGTAEIALRRVLDDEILRFRITGDEHGFVDMPTMWTHKISNVGEDELLTMFWTDQLLDPAAPDTYREHVESEGNRGL